MRGLDAKRGERKPVIKEGVGQCFTFKGMVLKMLPLKDRVELFGGRDGDQRRTQNTLSNHITLL